VVWVAKGWGLARPPIDSDDVRQHIGFQIMTHQLKDDATFYRWIEKLYATNKALTIRYMTKNAQRFSQNNLDYYNGILTANRRERHTIC